MKVFLVGNPNVGKSVLFSALTGKYATVSNYPGTTVEMTSGMARWKGREIEVIDTPGLYSLLPISEEERVARDMVLFEDADAIINVVDAKNLGRMLSLTMQLIDTGLPVILVLNMMDEAARAGFAVDAGKLSLLLGIPVFPVVAVRGEGVDGILDAVCAGVAPGTHHAPCDEEIEAAADQLATTLDIPWRASRRSIAYLLLQRDREVMRRVAERQGVAVIDAVEPVLLRLSTILHASVDYLMALRRQLAVDDIVAQVVDAPRKRTMHPVSDKVSRITLHPVWGYPILAVVLYFGLYQFVGKLGAGTMVDWIQSTVFDEWLLPAVIAYLEQAVPWDWLKELLIREYGIITLGIKYAVAIVLPIVASFFLFFSVIEDSGYLPRLAMLMDRLFKRMGMTGKAVIPLVLGFGCDTMATMVTRTLNSNKERVIATILLSLAIPCSAQLGVMLAVLSHSPLLVGMWVAVLCIVFAVVGLLAKTFVSGETSLFFVEIPPVRLPRPWNIFQKTYTRLVWYFKEVIPLFIAASLFIWVGRMTGIFDLLVKAIAVPLRVIGLPEKAAEIFLFGFFRRDYGAAGLYEMGKKGVFTNNELLVMAVMLTLFLPCIAQFIMTVKERGMRMGCQIALFVLVAAVAVGMALHAFLAVTGIIL